MYLRDTDERRETRASRDVGGASATRPTRTNTTPTPTKECVKTPTKATYFTHDTTEELEEILMKDEFVASEIVRVALGGWHAFSECSSSTTCHK